MAGQVFDKIAMARPTSLRFTLADPLTFILEVRMQIDQDAYDKIAREIHSDNSPVGIDAKKTHILILHLLEKIDKRLAAVEEKLNQRS